MGFETLRGRGTVGKHCAVRVELCWNVSNRDVDLFPETLDGSDIGDGKPWALVPGMGEWSVNHRTSRVEDFGSGRGCNLGVDPLEGLGAIAFVLSGHLDEMIKAFLSDGTATL